MKNNEITIPPANIPSAKDKIEHALEKLQRAWDSASAKHDTPTASWIHDARMLIIEAKAKLK